MKTIEETFNGFSFDGIKNGAKFHIVPLNGTEPKTWEAALEYADNLVHNGGYSSVSISENITRLVEVVEP